MRPTIQDEVGERICKLLGVDASRVKSVSLPTCWAGDGDPLTILVEFLPDGRDISAIERIFEALEWREKPQEENDHEAS